MKKFYYAVTCGYFEGKHGSFVATLGGETNLKTVIEQTQGIEVLQACKTKAEAEELVEKWDNEFKKNGTYVG